MSTNALSHTYNKILNRIISVLSFCYSVGLSFKLRRIDFLMSNKAMNIIVHPLNLFWNCFQQLVLDLVIRALYINVSFLPAV